jgi:hypothetical protein
MHLQLGTPRKGHRTFTEYRVGGVFWTLEGFGGRTGNRRRLVRGRRGRCGNVAGVRVIRKLWGRRWHDMAGVRVRFGLAFLCWHDMTGVWIGVGR